MATATLTLADFLLARIAEDEAVAHDVQHHERFGQGMVNVCSGGAGVRELASPSRWLAECAAKRRILELHQGGVHRCITGRVTWSSECVEARALAAVYADHPDYRDDWRA